MGPQVARRIASMLQAIERIHMFIGALRAHELAADPQCMWAVERGFEIISEASRSIPDDLKARHSTIPWREIAMIGNRLRHRYWEIDPEILWETALWDLPPLKVALEDMQRDRDWADD